MDDKLLVYGNKIKLQSMRPSDVDLMMNWGVHEDNLFDDYNFPYMDPMERQQWFKHKTKGFKRCFSIFNQENILVGYIALREVKILARTSVLGIVFDPNYVNHGYGTDAIRTLLKWYFEKLRYRKMILTVTAYNKRGIRTYEKVGFQMVSESYSEFMNKKINPLVQEEYADIRQYFRKKGNIIQVLYYKMEVSTLSTK